jgi:predicted ABC-type sugar transport system permease subunit
VLTKIAATTAFLSVVLNFVVLMGWWDLSTDQITGANLVIAGAGALVHSWFNPSVPLGVTEGE